MNAGSIIGGLGGIEATLLRCIDTEDDFATIVAKKREQEKISRDILKQNTELVSREGVRCDIGNKKYGKVGERIFYHKQYSGWVETKMEAYQENLHKCEIQKQELLEQENEYQALVAAGIIPATIDNLRIVMRHLQHHDWGTWVLPQMSIAYSAHQYDCDGKTAVTIKLDSPIYVDDQKMSKFVYGAPHGHLVSYTSIK